MRMLLALLLALLVTIGSGCSADKANTSVEVTRIGTLPLSEGQHPGVTADDFGVPGGRQLSFQPVEAGKRTQQIILLFPRSLDAPTATNRLIEVKGRLHNLETTKGFAPNNRFPYTVLCVDQWKYVGDAP